MFPNNPPYTYRTAAFFDVDGTLTATNLVNTFVDYKVDGWGALNKALWLVLFAPRFPYYMMLDRISRRRFICTFARNYKKVSLEKLEEWGRNSGRAFWSAHLFPHGVAQIRWHREQGHRVVLVTGGLRPVVEPLTALLQVDACLAGKPDHRNGHLTGKLAVPPLCGPTKAKETQTLAEQLNIDLSRSYGYADNISDKEFLELLGHPVAVNPDRRLRRIACERGWQVRYWHLKDWRRK